MEKIIIGIDHGYGNIKTAHHCFRTGVTAYQQEPNFTGNLLVYNGVYYQIGQEHKEFLPSKVQDMDYYILTLAAVAKELDDRGLNNAAVHIAAGLPLTWVRGQKEEFKTYLLQNTVADFEFKGKPYHVEFTGADIFPQGFSAVAYRLREFDGVNLLADIGNGTMNLMYINDRVPLEQKCYTEKYGTNQCALAIREAVMQNHHHPIDDSVVERFLRTGNADVPSDYLATMRQAADLYVQGIYRKLREHEYNPDLVKLYVIGGGGCMIRNFSSGDMERIVINQDICAAAKGYELLAAKRLKRQA